MTILHISDTHNLHSLLGELPQADVLVFSGDMGMQGTEDEIINFLNWFMDQPHAHKIFVAGNHDDRLWGEQIEGLDTNCYFLDNRGITIDGVHFYGLSGCRDVFDKVPEKTDVLITHVPPRGILSVAKGREFGNAELLACIEFIQPRLHLFGHIHAVYGVEEHGKTLFSNAALVDEDYNLAHQPRLLNF